MSTSYQKTVISNDEKSVKGRVLDTYFIRDSHLDNRPDVEYIQDEQREFFRLTSGCDLETSIQIDQPVNNAFTYCALES